MTPTLATTAASTFNNFGLAWHGQWQTNKFHRRRFIPASGCELSTQQHNSTPKPLKWWNSIICSELVEQLLESTAVKEQHRESAAHQYPLIVEHWSRLNLMALSMAILRAPGNPRFQPPDSYFRPFSLTISSFNTVLCAHVKHDFTTWTRVR